MKALKNATLFLALAAASASAQAAGGTISGTWKVTGDVSGHGIDQICTFAQDGKKLTGSCKSAEQNTDSVITGEVSEQKVSWQYNTDYNGEKLTVTFTGKLEASGSQLKGDIDVQPMAVGGTFAAQRQEAKKGQ